MIERDAMMVLNAVPGLGSVRIRKLLEHTGSAEGVFRSSHDESLRGIIPFDVIEHLRAFSVKDFLEKENKLIEQFHVKVVTCLDPIYPQTLKEIHDYPVVLYVKGDVTALNAFSVGIVGSRKASLYGLQTAEQFAMCLAEKGVCIASGMARGIDTSAHQGALKAKGATIAVLGCGLAHVYPPENAKLFQQIAETGAVISEFPMDTLPVSFNFPRRNRIISGLSQGIIVVEAAEKSGALITADSALEQGKDVYAVPGPINSPTARGANHLIQQGAKLIMSIDDVLEDLEEQIALYLDKEEPAANVSGNRHVQNVQFPELSQDEQLVFAHLGDQPVHIDDLNIHTTSAAAVLFQLELKQLIKQLPGKQYVRQRKL